MRKKKGESRPKEHMEWARKVKERDNYTCQKCGYNKSRGYLHAHHIKNWQLYPALRFEISNGVTYCRKCHASFHPGLEKLITGISPNIPIAKRVRKIKKKTKAKRISRKIFKIL